MIGNYQCYPSIPVPLIHIYQTEVWRWHGLAHGHVQSIVLSKCQSAILMLIDTNEQGMKYS